MSHGPPTYNTYPPIPSPTLPSQTQIVSPHAFQPLHPQSRPNGSQHTQGMPQPRQDATTVGVGADMIPGPPPNIYCERCQQARPSDFFEASGALRYNMCSICRSRDAQRRRNTEIDRYEQASHHYNAQQRQQQSNVASASSQPQQPQQQPRPYPTHVQTGYQHLRSHPQLPPQVSPHMHQSQLPLSPMQTQMLPPQPPPLRSQSHMQQSPIPSSPQLRQLPPQQLAPPQNVVQQQNRQQAQQQPPPTAQQQQAASNWMRQQPPQAPDPVKPSPTTTASGRTDAKRSNARANGPQGGTLLNMPSNTHNSSLEVLSPEVFVETLRQSQNFERKQFAIDMAPIIAEAGNEAGFTQLGRAVCDRVLQGTGYNFSLKDKRASTKNPLMVTTLRYYCSQRSDTAKHRKPEHPKASNRYECAGALTIIIDLSKIAGYVTLTHKDPHPPFISPNSNSSESRSQHSSQQQMLAHQRLEDKFEKLKVKVLQFADLIEQQKPFHSKQFLNIATDAFQSADEMLTACSVFELDPAPKNANKYTTHYRRRANAPNTNSG
ncbi:hypothetical protein VKS41_002929 [Umbelopsis sp. WA50703]